MTSKTANLEFVVLSYLLVILTRLLAYTVEALYNAPLYNEQSAVTDPKKIPRSVTFFNSVIKTPLLRTLLTDIRQLRTLFCPD